MWIPFQKEDGPKYYLYQLEGEGSDDRDQEKSALLLVLKMYKETVNNKDVVSVVLQRGGGGGMRGKRKKLSRDLPGFFLNNWRV